MIGAFSPQNDKSVAYIFGVYVVPEARGKGISKKLMAFLLHDLKANPDIIKATLSVNQGQLAAVKLYASFGFQLAGEENVQLGDEPVPKIVRIA
jgi:ribosomal protein S18 acetylase RimI-like enzyme